jgi:GT2 family glycosyltransferase
MMSVAPVGIIIPTYNRGFAVLSTLRHVKLCDPSPAEIWIHVDAANGVLEDELARQFPDVHVLTSPVRLGAGAGRHRCLMACNEPYVFSFDDDSYPVDTDLFSRIEQLFLDHPRAAVIGATIWHRHQSPIARNKTLVRMPSFTGCGHVIRSAAYRQLRGYLPRPDHGHGLEETHLSLQMFVSGWEVYQSGELRVFHDTDLSHHQSPEITSAVVTNIGLFAFLNYSAIGWVWGLLQLANTIAFSLKVGRVRGILRGLLQLPVECYRYRHFRRPVPWSTIRKYLLFRRTGLNS